jgi:hypothetical protein
MGVEEGAAMPETSFADVNRLQPLVSMIETEAARRTGCRGCD